MARDGYQILVTENTYRHLGKIPPDMEFKKHIDEKMPHSLSVYYEVNSQMGT